MTNIDAVRNSDDALGDACRRLNEQAATALTAGKSLGGLVRECIETAQQAYSQGRSDLTAAILSPLAQSDVSSPRLYFLLALAHRDLQDLDAARLAIAKAAALAPGDAEIAFAHAQFSFENWRSAARLFRAAQRLAPDNLDIKKNAAAALFSEGKGDASLKILTRVVAANPDWVEGHQQISKYRILSGDRDGFDQNFHTACQSSPGNLALRLAWFHVLAQAREWRRARNVIDEGENIIGDKRAFEIARAFIASESGNDDEAEKRLESLVDVQDPGLDLCKVRFFLRTGDAVRAEAIAARHIGKESVRSFWPYLSLAWRLLGDDRAAWLDRDGSLIKSRNLAVDDGFMDELVATLRRLHTAKSPYLEQSVRGGTQTDRNLFFNGDPIIQEARRMIADAVREYAAALPPPEKGHPLLGAPRNQFRFSGSWSVRLGKQGFHVAHTHTAGWISSAFYVSLPEAAALGKPPAGWISFGEAPPELNIDLPPYVQVEPEPGHLVLFPSTMWHRTIPFDGGERLTIAFDVGVPAN